MAKQPEGKSPAKPNKPAVKGETFKQVPNADQVKGGMMRNNPGKTDNATKTDAYCCGEG